MRFRKTEQEWLVEVCLILKKGKKEKDVRVGKNKGKKEQLIKKQASNTNGCCAQRANTNKKCKENLINLLKEVQKIRGGFAKDMKVRP